MQLAPEVASPDPPGPIGGVARPLPDPRRDAPGDDVHAVVRAAVAAAALDATPASRGIDAAAAIAAERRRTVMTAAHRTAREYVARRKADGAQAEQLIIEFRTALYGGVAATDARPDAVAKMASQVVAWCVAAYYDIERAD